MCSISENRHEDSEFEMTDLFDNANGTDLQFTQLTEMVRNHYTNYLEKQLLQNFKTCYDHKIFHGEAPHSLSNEETFGTIKETAKFLEDKALAACMIAQFYQRAMVKIISIVRRSTEENRLLKQLQNYINQPDKTKTKLHNKQTQTDEHHLQSLNQNYRINSLVQTKENISHIEKNVDYQDHEMTLDEKIQLFQHHLERDPQKLPISPSFNTKERKTNSKTSKRKNHLHHKVNRYHHRPYKEKHLKPASPADTVITAIGSNKKLSVDEHHMDILDDVVADMENSNDSVALELARLFSEEKTELDEIFGIDPNEEPDDPQIRKILNEIEQATVCNQQKVINHQSDTENEKIQKKNNNTLSPVIQKAATTVATDLGKSLWPCELFMQRKKLSDSLARLIEEDLRWHDVIKWRFFELFGEDSDDEFTPCSPSIELDDILMGSCVKRISPWVVKHLMKPMNDGLIGNRFIFKKLAKHIARSVIMENQYPDESIIKGCVENYFCLHQSVLTLDSLQDVPSISLF